MCGVIGLVCERHREDLGRIAAELLKTLEYRGYDSTGAAIQGDGLDVALRKGVGAPSVMVNQLGIVDLAGQVLCGQVRWATFGAVDDLNAQPHIVSHRRGAAPVNDGDIALYGAHNGNVTNCDTLKAWLLSEGHRVLSDNDGEMVVQTIAHYFAHEIAELDDDDKRLDATERRAAMRRAIVTAGARLEGSYTAVVVDPVTRVAWAIKEGSSLYFGRGQDDGGSFGIASSDLSSVLKMTRVVVPVIEGEFVEFDAHGSAIYCIADRTITDKQGNKQHFEAGQIVERTPKRSRLRAKDTVLLPQFDTFMDQEISAQELTVKKVAAVFLGGTQAVHLLWPLVEARPDGDLPEIRSALDKLRDQYDDEQIKRGFHALVDMTPFQQLLETIPEDLKHRGTDAPSPEHLADKLVSSEAGFFADLLAMARDRDDKIAVRVLDVLLERAEVREYAEAVERFCQMCREALARGGRIFAICCGSSFHAAKAAALFFNEVARVELVPVLPGEFRAQYQRSLRDGDLFIAISQSGETKDLIDVMNTVIESSFDIGRVAVVNNVNSTLAQEKADLVIPLRCGPEIAVPATKSFINQMMVLYCLSLRLGERRLPEMSVSTELRTAIARDIAERIEKLEQLPALIRETFDTTNAEIETAAQLLFLEPSIQILATRVTAVAKEGALKIREVVLNHTEGFEGSEFKHGPNTILGFNTLFGPRQVDTMLKKVGDVIAEVTARAQAQGLTAERVGALVQSVTDSVLSPGTPFALNNAERELLGDVLDRAELIDALYSDYPLIYITGPIERDVLLTVSQINTHKIRGASTVVIAEDHAALRQAASKAPTDNPNYRSVFIPLPRTKDTIMTVFSSTVVLQRLALKMSLMKMQYLDRLGIQQHGVHPDVPKNVSKSITVD
ncbi:MAG: SIS domain-containing protein [Myxococcales bacterium]|nr:SIS domain-containing protein [Myxococcales bacterium]